MSFEVGRFIGGLIASLLMVTAAAVLASFLFRRFMSPVATAAASVFIGLIIVAVVSIRDAQTGVLDWNNLPAVAVAAAIVFLIWRWRISLKTTDVDGG